MPSYDQNFTPTNGVDGMVRSHTNFNKLAGITSWKRNSTAQITRLGHFLSPADTHGVIQPRKIRADGDNKVSIEGIYNLDPTAQTENGTTGLYNGAYVALDLYVSQTGLTGYQNVLGWITSFSVGQKFGNEACSFSCEVEVDGVFPAYGTIT